LSHTGPKSKNGKENLIINGFGQDALVKPDTSKPAIYSLATFVPVHPNSVTERQRWSVFEFHENVPGEVLFNLAMTRDRLTGAGSWILIPIVHAAVPDENASVLLNPTD